jgi:hypothetical protein
VLAAPATALKTDFESALAIGLSRATLRKNSGLSLDSFLLM